MDDLNEHTARAIHRALFSRSRIKVTDDAEMYREDLDVDVEMRREAAHRLDKAAERMPDKPRIAALSLAFWLTTTASPEATEAARVLLGHAEPSVDTEDGA